MKRWPVVLPWAVAVVASWCFVAAGSVDNFFIENTTEALRQAADGQRQAALGAVVLGALAAVVPFFLRTKFPRSSTALIGGAALVVLVTSSSEIVLATGLLSALPVGLGVLLALVPEPTPDA